MFARKQHCSKFAFKKGSKQTTATFIYLLL